MALSGCGGGGGGGTCGNTAACGGDIVGTWKITSSCIEVDVSDLAPSDCPTATVKSIGNKITGTVTYNADLTTSGSSTLSGGMELTLPAECLPTGPIATTCSQLTQAVKADPDAPFATINCVAAGTGCKCTGTFPDQVATIAGTYTTTAAGVLTETDADNQVDQSDYCIKGTTLTLSPHADAGMMGQAAARGTITAAKQ